MDPTAAAFFDVDNTLMRGASIYYLARGLAARRYFTTGDLVRFGMAQLRFRVRSSEDAEDVSAARDSALAFVAGRSVQRLRQLSEEIFDELIADRISAGPLRLARRHLAAGQRVWLVTAAPEELAEVIAERLELTGAIGTVAEIRDGIYTGRLVGELMHGQAKADAITRLAASAGLDVARCSAYSDSVNDVPMLSAVGRAVAVNPDPALRRTALERGWEIRDFRTGRARARVVAKVVVPAALGAGALAGAVAAGLAAHRRAEVRRSLSRTGPGGAATARTATAGSPREPGRPG